MALSQITAKTKITASTLNGIIDVVNSLQTANPTAYITKTWVSGTSWYRKYSDGWIEQGGRLTCPTGGGNVQTTLHQSFTNTNYCIQLTPFLANVSAYAPTIASQTKANFSTYYFDARADVPAFWVAFGF